MPIEKTDLSKYTNNLELNYHKLSSFYNYFINEYDLKNSYSLSINHKGFEGGICAGLSMFWLICTAKEYHPELFCNLNIRHHFTKCSLFSSIS
jgi:hypothetical protein